jgi:hypothetical protein
MKIKNYFNTYCLFLIFWLPQKSFGQFVPKKDSSKLVPFESFSYYYPNIEDSIPFIQHLEKNHLTTKSNEIADERILLGNIGSELLSIGYNAQFHERLHSGRSLFENYFFNNKTIPLFNLNKPLSQLDFTFFGYGVEVFEGMLAQNLSKKTHIGVGVKQMNNKGFFSNTAVKHYNYYAYFSHQTERLRTHIQFWYNDISNQNQSGFVEDFLPTTKPSLWNSQITKTPNAINQVSDGALFIRNRFLITKDPRRNDSTWVFKNLHRPLRSSFYLDNDFGYQSETSSYIDSKPDSAFYPNFFTTNDKSFGSYFRNNRWSNTFSIFYELQKNKKEIFSIKGFLQTDLNQISRGSNSDSATNSTNFVIAFGGVMKSKLPLNTHLENNAYLSLTGYTQGDFRLSSKLVSIQKDIQIESQVQLFSQRPGYFHNYFESKNTSLFFDLRNQKTLDAYFKMNMPKYNMNLRIGYTRVEDFFYFDANWNPNNIVMSGLNVQLEKELSYGVLYSNHRWIYQTGIFEKMWYKGTFALRNKAFDSHLTYMIGGSLNIIATHRLMNYNPLFMQFTDVNNASKANIFPLVDLFATAKINTVLISLCYENTMTSILENNTYSAQFFPFTPSSFYLKMQWRFLE